MLWSCSCSSPAMSCCNARECCLKGIPSGITPGAAAFSDSSDQCSPTQGISCSPSAASYPTTGSRGSPSPVWSDPFQQLLPEHRAMEGTQGTSPCMSQVSTLHNTSHGAAHQVLEVLGAGTRTLPSLPQPRGCLRSSVVSAPTPFLPAPPPVKGLLCQIPPHALARTLVQDGPTRMLCPYGVPASSGAGNHSRPLALASAPALPHCQAPPQFPAHCFKEEQHPIHAFHSRVLRSCPWIYLDSFLPVLLWPWLC